LNFLSTKLIAAVAGEAAQADFLVIGGAGEAAAQ
jgi:hypothetical protein